MVVPVGAVITLVTVVVPLPAVEPTNVPPHEPLKNSTVPNILVAVGNVAVRVILLNEPVQKFVLLVATEVGGSLNLLFTSTVAELAELAQGELVVK